MDVAILGTGVVGRRFARASFFGTARAGHTDESTDRSPSEPVTTDSGDPDTTEQFPTVTLYGVDATAVMDTVDVLEETFRERGNPGPADHLERLDGTTDLETAVGDADVAIETRSADLETVRHRLAGVEERLDDETILAIHTDVAEPTAAAAALENPERAIGLSIVDGGKARTHNAQSPSGNGDREVTEIVRADQTDDATVDSVSGFLDGLGWTSVVVNDAPGYVSDRLQLALEAEAMRAVEAEVATPAAIDDLVETGFGHATGPLAAADRAGLDNRLETLEELAVELGERFEPPAILRAKVQAGQLGEKTGSGFREWDDDQPVDETVGTES